LSITSESIAEPVIITTFHGLFEDQAERTPGIRAVVAHDGQFSYAELNRRSNQLAHYLQSLGIRPEMRVGIALPRSAEMIVAALAVLKAGGAYVPIDPAYPPQRFRYLAEDSQVSVLLTHRAVPEGLSPKSVQIIPLESHWGRIAAFSEKNPDSGSNGANLAYIIYTSGSTGKPKGVMVSHENAIHSTQARLEYYALQPGRFLVLSSFSFDSSVASIFWTLLAGGELWLTPEGTQQNIARIAELVRHGSITHLLALPSLYKSLLLQSTNNELRSLRMTIVAGEACPADLVKTHFRQLPETSLFNEYGPTEATVWSTVYQTVPELHTNSIPIGKPISTVQAHILDAQMALVAPQESGELYLGGPQLARGYLDRPDLTAEKFLPDPFARVPGARLYRTGDLCRYRAGGDIEFLGRVDQQVKIRGHRIELGEIETALREHPQVAEAVVASKQDQEGHPRLAAYVVSRGEKLDAIALRRFLSQSLPGYMVPTTYMVLDHLPVNVNGKLDRQALPDPKPAESQNTYVAPRNQAEQRLAEIWMDLLGVKRVGIHDDFFDLGGDSILGLQIVARANHAGIRLNVTQIVEQPTIAGLAANSTLAEPPATSYPGEQQNLAR
jgi:amino acid adenylation domain-containing protein